MPQQESVQTSPVEERASAYAASYFKGLLSTRREADDETASVTTELSTRAEAGSAAPSGLTSPTSERLDDPMADDDLQAHGRDVSPDEEMDDDKDEGEDSEDMHGEDRNDDGVDRVPSPPGIHLEPRLYPVGTEDVGAQMNEKQADEAESRTHNEAVAEDDHSSNEGNDEVDRSGIPRKRRAKHGSKA